MTPDAIQPAQILWPIITILVALASLAGVAIAWYGVRKRTPPLAEELAKVYATKTELGTNIGAINDRIDREMSLIRHNASENSRKLDGLITTTNRTSEEAQRSLGRIEGKLDAHLEAHQ